MGYFEEKWNETLNLLKKELMPASYNSFFANLNFVEIDRLSGNIVLSTDTPAFINVINERYSQLLKNCIQEAYGKAYSVSFLSEDDIKRRNLNSRVNAEEEFIFNPAYNFENFVVGSNNKYAYAAASAVAEFPSEAYNPLYIYGGSGLGKTHLMHAIGMYIMERYPEKKILYISSEMFTNEFIAATQNKTMHEFKEKYRKIDVLLIDDIQFLEGKKETQEEFFHTFNTLYDLNKQIVISSDIAPNKLSNMDERLRSRFQWKLVVDISSPEYETRVAILRKKAELSGISVDNDVNEVINLIAEKVKYNIRELEGAFTRVLSFSKIMGEKIDLRFAKNILKDILKASDFTVTPENIKKAVCKQYNISIVDIESKKKAMNITLPRQIAMYICKEMTDLSLSQIGKSFGGRDHSTVFHSCEKIANEMKTNEEMKNVVNKLIDDINGK